MASEPKESEILARLFAVIESRRGGDPATSYTARLLAQGTEEIAHKVGEEALETVVAALQHGRREVIAESADLLYHLLVLWAEAGVRPEEVWAELARREGTSGLAEKRARSRPRPVTKREG